MTPRELAEKAVTTSTNTLLVDWVECVITSVLAKVIADEREECATLVENTDIERYGSLGSYYHPDNADAT
jgi:regulator of RNase E activity RraB